MSFRPSRNVLLATGLWVLALATIIGCALDVRIIQVIATAVLGLGGAGALWVVCYGMVGGFSE